MPARLPRIQAAPATELPAAPLIANKVPEVPGVPPDEPPKSSAMPAEPAAPAQAVLPQGPPPDLAVPVKPAIIADGPPLTREMATGTAEALEIRAPPPPTIALEEPKEPQEETFDNWLAETASPDVSRANRGPQTGAPPVTEPDAAPSISDTVPGLAEAPTEGEPSITSSSTLTRPTDHAESVVPQEPSGVAVAPAPTIVGAEGSLYAPSTATGASERLSERAATPMPEAVPPLPPRQAGTAEPTTRALGIDPRGEASPIVQSHPNVDQTRPSSELFVQSYPLIVLEGVEVGAVPMRISSDDVISIYLGSFLSLFESRMDPATFQRLRGAKAADQYVTLEVLRSFGLNMTYDSKREKLTLDIQ